MDCSWRADAGQIMSVHLGKLLYRVSLLRLKCRRNPYILIWFGAVNKHFGTSVAKNNWTVLHERNLGQLQWTVQVRKMTKLDIQYTPAWAIADIDNKVGNGRFGESTISTETQGMTSLDIQEYWLRSGKCLIWTIFHEANDVGVRPTSMWLASNHVWRVATKLDCRRSRQQSKNDHNSR